MEILVGQGLRFASALGSSPCFVAKCWPKSLRYVRCTSSRFGSSDQSGRYPHSRIFPYSHTSHLNSVSTYEKLFDRNINNNNGAALARYFTSQPPLKEDGKDTQKESEKSPSLFQKMKQMTKDYWYILIPVHVITSMGWVSVFYMTVKNGVDIASLMEYMHLNEKYVQAIRNSSAGNWALVYLLYKIFTPFRYTVTIGGTTMVISSLNKRGLLKASELKKGIKEHRQMKKPACETLHFNQVYRRS